MAVFSCSERSEVVRKGSHSLRGRAGGVATRLSVVKIAFVHCKRPAHSNVIARLRAMTLRRNAREPPRGAAGGVSQQEKVMRSAASQNFLLL